MSFLRNRSFVDDRQLFSSVEWNKKPALYQWQNICHLSHVVFVSLYNKTLFLWSTQEVLRESESAQTKQNSGTPSCVHPSFAVFASLLPWRWIATQVFTGMFACCFLWEILLNIKKSTDVPKEGCFYHRVYFYDWVLGALTPGQRAVQ